MVESVVEGDWKLINRKRGFVFVKSISKRCHALADDYRQNLDLHGNERRKSREFNVQVDREANAETNIFETEHVVSHSVKLKSFAVGLAMSKTANFSFRLDIHQPLLKAIKNSRFLCQMSSDNTLHESCWWFKTMFGV